MARNEQVTAYWNAFCRVEGTDPDSEYQVWHFGDNRDLAERMYKLVLDGPKRATACLYVEDDPDPQPAEGQICVVTDFDGDPKCILRLTEVRTIPFNEVDAVFAFDEGEGDRSLDYWRQAHWNFFSRCCAELGTEPAVDMPVMCQRFELLYPKDS